MMTVQHISTHEGLCPASPIKAKKIRIIMNDGTGYSVPMRVYDRRASKTRCPKAKTLITQLQLGSWQAAAEFFKLHPYTPLMDRPLTEEEINGCCNRHKLETT